ncbi:hypothetical protein D3C77_415820 [compost metagenome]
MLRAAVLRPDSILVILYEPAGLGGCCAAVVPAGGKAMEHVQRGRHYFCHGHSSFSTGLFIYGQCVEKNPPRSGMGCEHGRCGEMEDLRPDYNAFGIAWRNGRRAARLSRLPG